jgi:hypothetical protein
VPTLDGWEAESHSLSIGEVKAKVFHRPEWRVRWNSLLAESSGRRNEAG